MENGAYVVLASGRMIEAILPYAEQVKPNAPVIAFNGGMTYDIAAKKSLDKLPVPAAVARELAKTAEDMGIHIQAFDETGYYYAEDNWGSAFYASKLRIPGRAVHHKLSEYVTDDLCKCSWSSIQRGAVPDGNVPRQVRRTRQLRHIPSLLHRMHRRRRGQGRRASTPRAAPGCETEEIVAFGDAHKRHDHAALRRARITPWPTQGPRCCRRCNTSRPPNSQDGVAQIVEQLLREGLFVPAGKEQA
jgi:hypothetical protein